MGHYIARVHRIGPLKLQEDFPKFPCLQRHDLGIVWLGISWAGIHIMLPCPYLGCSSRMHVPVGFPARRFPGHISASGKPEGYPFSETSPRCCPTVLGRTSLLPGAAGVWLQDNEWCLCRPIKQISCIAAYPSIAEMLHLATSYDPVSSYNFSPALCCHLFPVSTPSVPSSSHKELLGVSLSSQSAMILNRIRMVTQET